MHSSPDASNNTGERDQLLIHCREQVVALNRMQGWGLDAQGIEHLAIEILPHLSKVDFKGKDKAKIIADVITYYREEQPSVLALLDRWQPEHERHWREWCAAVAAILRRQNLLWMRDCALDDNDVVQEALVELVEALPTYHYQSRFRVWARTVIINHILAMITASHRNKRKAQIVSYDVDSHAELLADPLSVDEHADGRLLLEAAAQALNAHPKQQRLWRVFVLRAHDDHTFQTIADRLGVSKKRAKVLYDKAQHILQHHPELRAWIADHADATASDPANQVSCANEVAA